MVNRYTPTVLEGAAHMEPMGAGEWVKWEDYDRARAEGKAEGLREAVDHAVACVDAMDKYDQAECCNGYMCGCQGSTVHQHIRHHIRALIPASPAEPAQVTVQAVEALASYQQADMDGVMVLVSRQAIEECLPALRAIAGGKP